MEQYWFLREGETGLHSFSRLAYYNATTPFLRNLQEMRTLFRPSTPLWTHLSTNDQIYAPLPSSEVLDNSIVVQDATWDIANYTSEPYVEQMADYFTKYTFSDPWRDHDVHGLFADGSESVDGRTYGAWLVMNTRDTYFGGSLHSDLTVDGIVYNYIGRFSTNSRVPAVLTFIPQLQTIMVIMYPTSHTASIELSDHSFTILTADLQILHCKTCVKTPRSTHRRHGIWSSTTPLLRMYRTMCPRGIERSGKPR